MGRRKLTPFGLEVKKKLLDMGVTAKEFCEENKIPAKKFSDLLTGDRKTEKYIQIIREKLKISA
ncbi:hypothetical protein [Desulforamulus ruminis]|uniref:Phage-associated protein, BcepMu gp16 family n=1 Tax=Desulforamulus ruminis (strain ATCC 23193 / DSM 2154 / NCIMB 8452 / DL) TaxID=696281 RepID=F6DTI2_DESRL|nr:hypothetical protein [Desulforamulus ruminis]AEG60044.1 hypothetical protein Desru_1781 [Desulforamulus ruminis DSM 2154]